MKNKSETIKYYLSELENLYLELNNWSLVFEEIKKKYPSDFENIKLNYFNLVRNRLLKNKSNQNLIIENPINNSFSPKKSKKLIILEKFYLIDEYLKCGYSLTSILEGLKKSYPEFKSIKYTYFVSTLKKIDIKQVENISNLILKSKNISNDIDDDIKNDTSVWEKPTEHRLLTELKNGEKKELEFKDYQKKMFDNDFLEKYEQTK